MKHSNLKEYNNNFKALLFSLICSSDDWKEQLDTLNKLIIGRLNQHTPLVKTKFTYTGVPWMKQLDIAELQR